MPITMHSAGTEEADGENEDSTGSLSHLAGCVLANLFPTLWCLHCSQALRRQKARMRIDGVAEPPG